jgi:hypothetical protein
VFCKLIKVAELTDVSSSFAMEEIKYHRVAARQA